MKTIKALIERVKRFNEDTRLGIVRDSDGTPHYRRAL